MTRRQRLLDDWQALAKAARRPGRGEAKRARQALRDYAHSLLASDVGVTQVVMQFPIGRPVPEGWRLCERQTANHGHAYSQLIRRVPA